MSRSDHVDPAAACYLFSITAKIRKKCTNREEAAKQYRQLCARFVSKSIPGTGQADGWTPISAWLEARKISILELLCEDDALARLTHDLYSYHASISAQGERGGSLDESELPATIGALPKNLFELCPVLKKYAPNHIDTTAESATNVVMQAVVIDKVRRWGKRRGSTEAQWGSAVWQHEADSPGVNDPRRVEESEMPMNSTMVCPTRMEMLRTPAVAQGAPDSQALSADVVEPSDKPTRVDTLCGKMCRDIEDLTQVCGFWFCDTCLKDVMEKDE